MANTYFKTPGETTTYFFDYSNFPEVLGDSVRNIDPQTITAATITVVPDDGNLEAASATFPSTGDGAYSVITGGVAGTTYTLKCLATFSGGDQREIDGTINVVNQLQK